MIYTINKLNTHFLDHSFTKHQEMCVRVCVCVCPSYSIAFYFDSKRWPTNVKVDSDEALNVREMGVTQSRVILRLPVTFTHSLYSLACTLSRLIDNHPLHFDAAHVYLCMIYFFAFTKLNEWTNERQVYLHDVLCATSKKKASWLTIASSRLIRWELSMILSLTLKPRTKTNVTQSYRCVAAWWERLAFIHSTLFIHSF